MKIFSKEKFFEVEGREDYDWIVEAGIPEKKQWLTMCDGKTKEECEKEGWRICDEWCIEKGEEKRTRYEIKISADGDLTTAEMIVEGKIVKTATAKRNPADKFNFKTGAELAFTRLFAKKTKEKDSESKRPLRVGDRVVCQAPTDEKQEIVGMHGGVITNKKHTTCLGVEFEYYTLECFLSESGGCLGTKEIDPCEGENCKKWKRKEERQ